MLQPCWLLDTCYVLGATCYTATRYMRVICYQLPKICWNDAVAMLGRCWNGVATIATTLVEQCCNDVEQCMNDVQAAFQQHPSRAILPAASFQRHRSSIVEARSSIAPSIILASSSIIPALFQHRSSIVSASIVPHNSSIV